MSFSGNSMPASRRRIRVAGVVQGVGFRPFVYSLAQSIGLTGFVGNDADGVFIEIEGDQESLTEFIRRISLEAPPLSRIESIDATEIPCLAHDEFTIVDSSDSSGSTSIPPDTANCDDCLNEMRDPLNRRFGYPFIACTNCGPRYTIVEGLPYDRSHTTMADFPLCEPCQEEYDDPRSRRFHAQPTACPTCGPEISMPVNQIVDALLQGLIVAIKGVGGYHLACDATNPSTVSRLRERKQRGSKPFAVMVCDLDVGHRLADIDAESQRLLETPTRPIVLVPSKDSGIQESIAPGNISVGLMLPYAPIHHLLFDAGAPRALVMTSGNISDEPICITPAEATERLAHIADAFCHHDRRIHVACDDSVVKVVEGSSQPVRRSRGYAPLPIHLPAPSRPLLAVGGELKTTLCVSSGRRAWMSQHIGDTGNLETLAMLERTADTLCSLQRVHPEAIVSDLHPGYLSRKWAQQRAESTGVEHISVQHHHAHAASLMAEHGRTEPIIAFAFDGTGYGLDGTIWGGEILLATYATAERIGHLAPVALPGGDAATRHVNRIALAQLHAVREPWETDLPPVAAAAPSELQVIRRMLDTGTGCTPTTSMGRLFDAVSSLLSVRHTADYEGQAAIELEALAIGAASTDASGWGLDLSSDLVLDPAPSIRAAISSIRSGMPPAQAAWCFHQGVAEGVAQAAKAASRTYGVTTIGLTGGVFANSVLTRACCERLGAAGLEVLIHRQVPPNDGGLALGQVAVAAAGC